MENKGYGYIPSPKDIRNYKISKTKKEIDLPDSFQVEHSHIKDQGEVGSCVAHGISEVLETNDGINYSTGWIYGYRPDNYYQGEGMIPSEALKTITKVGYLENKDLDVNIEMMAAKHIVEGRFEYYIEKASEKKALSYAALNNVREIKEAIYKGKKPIVLCIQVGIYGLQLDGNYIANIPTEFAGGHLVVCYGWNETGLLIQNSWGEKWGKKGTFILPYEYPIEEAWVIKMAEPEDNELEIVKPNCYKVRELLMLILKLLRKRR